jgi:hypothetical protein
MIKTPIFLSLLNDMRTKKEINSRQQQQNTKKKYYVFVKCIASRFIDIDSLGDSSENNV